MLGGARNSALTARTQHTLTRHKNPCVVFIAHFTDGYRVIYHMNGEWLLDSIESRLSYAHQKAVRCIRAMQEDRKCNGGETRIFEITIASALTDSLQQGLRDPLSNWQGYMTHAADILKSCKQVNTASLIADTNPGDPDGNTCPFLFVVSSDAFGNQHHIDTVRLHTSKNRHKATVIHKVSQGMAQYNSEDTNPLISPPGPTASFDKERSLIQHLGVRLHGIFHPRSSIFGS